MISRWGLDGCVLELALLVPLSIATVWTQRRARKASTDEQWNLVGRQRLMMRRLAISLTALVTLVNFGALARLVEAILAGNAGSGRTLLLDALNIWATNVIIFALWYWALDRGSPATKGIRPDAGNDFLFTQQQPAGETCLHPGWTPGFIDYLFLAFTNATAFSPADTFPLTVRAKLSDDGRSRYFVCHNCARGIAGRRNPQLSTQRARQNTSAASKICHACVLNLFSHGSRRPSLRSVALAQRPQRSWPASVGQDCFRSIPNNSITPDRRA
jgi:hypothetical protein